MKKCPYCAEEIQDEATVCKHCGRDLKPEKKSSTGVLLLLIAGAIVICLIISYSGGGGGSVRRTSTPATYRVEYHVTGSTGAASLTYENKDGNTEQRDVYVPWEYKFTAQRGDFLYISAQNERGAGSIACEITVNGVAVETAESSGAYVIASCSGSVR